MVRSEKKLKRSALRRLSRGDRAFDAVNYGLMGIFLFIMLYPIYYTVIASVSDINEVGLGNVTILPRGFTLDAYRQILRNDAIWTGYRNTILYTVLGTLYGLAIMVPLAYALSKKFMFGRGIVTWFFLFTMYFSGGMVPNYLLRTQTFSMTNTVWVMVLGGVSVYNMVVTRTYFMTSIPEEIYESAEIDGANQFTCFFRLALPLSTPILAVMVLYYAVSFWNAYFNAMMYITQRDMYPLQLVLRNILILNEQMKTNPELIQSLSADQQLEEMAKARLAESMKYAVIFIASAPLLVAYPFVQKYFVKGMMIGSLKG